MSHWDGEERADYGQTEDNRDNSAPHDNLPLRSGHDGAEYSGNGAKSGNVTHALMLAFNLVQRNARLDSLALVLLVRRSCWSGTHDRFLGT